MPIREHASGGASIWSKSGLSDQAQISMIDGENRFGCGCQNLSRQFMTESNFGGAGAEPHYPRDLGIASVHIDIALKVSIAGQKVAGVVTHSVEARREGERLLVLDAVGFNNLQVTDINDIMANKSSVQKDILESTYDGKVVKIYWRDAFKKGEKRQVKISYEVEKPQTGLFFMSPNSLETNKPKYAATDHETERARYWLPCIDFPSVKTTLDWHLTAESDLTILANGYLVSEVQNHDGTKTAHWRLNEFCPSYLACFAIGDFVRCDHLSVGEIPVASFTSKDFTPEDLNRTFGRTPQMLRWMIERLKTPFPFPKYFQFAVPNFGGAMENISLVSWSDRFVCTEEIDKELSWLTDQVNVHEMAHSYFGDLVGCLDFAHVWLKESWATYMETCWLEDQKGQDEMRYDLFRNAEQYFDEVDQRYARPLVTRNFTSSWQMFDAHLYPGGACRIHTLRCELGDEVFWPAVTDYLQTFKHKVAETDDFRRVLEQHSGRSLQKFFDQWIETPGYPSIKVTFTYDKEKKRGVFEVIQKQAESGPQKRPVFELTTDLGWTTTLETVIYPIKITKQRQSFTIAMDLEPLQVRFDPMGKVLHKLEFDPGEAKALEQMSNAKDIAGRIHAARVLTATGQRKNIKSVAEAYKKEIFWGVRREMLKAFADTKSEEGLQALLEVFPLEKDHLVLDRLVGSIGTFRDQRVGNVLSAAVESRQLPPQANAQALQSLGQQKDKAPVDLIIKEITTDKSPHKIVARGGLMALGGTRQKEVIPYLKSQVTYGSASHRVRKAAVAGLAAIIPYLEKPLALPIEELLIDLLRDPELWLRSAAAQALGAARVTGAIIPLKAYSQQLSLQDRVGVDSIIEALSREDPAGRVAALEKQIDELSERWRKLDHRIQDLEDKK